MSRMLAEQQYEDFKWFKFMMPELFREYGECYAAIGDARTAIETVSREHEPGTLIVQRVGPDESVHTSMCSVAEHAA